MKKIFSLLILFISLLSFGQRKEYKQAVNLFNDKKYEESLVIVDKLLNKEFGNLTEEQEFYSLQMRINCYNSLKNYKKAYDVALPYLAFIKNSKSLFFEETKIKAIDEAEKTLEFYKSKLYSEQSISSNISTNSSTIQNTEAKSASDNKTVTLTVSGTGKTIEEAKTNALRSAIEQAFGAFISSKTEILNDNIIKDEVVSVTNGNIQKYDVISQVEIPNNGYAMTLSATVSIEKLISFAESKGIVIEFKGGMFAQNIKLQKLNEKSEIIALKNLCQKSYELLLNSLDFRIEASEPKSLFGNKEKYKIYNYKYDLKNGCYVKQFEEKDYFIDFTINVKSNNNLKLFYDNFNKTIISLSMSQSEINNYKSINKPHFAIRIYDKDYYLRNPESVNILRIFFTKMQLIPSFFEITSNVETYNNLLVNKWLNPIHNSILFLNFYERYYDSYYDYFRTEDYRDDSKGLSILDNKFPLFNDIFNFEQIEFEKDERKKLDRFFDLKSYFEIVPKDFESNFSISRSFTIEEIEKLDIFEIKKIDLLTTLKNEQDRIKNVKKIILYNFGYSGYVPDNYILELNDKKYECNNYCEYKIEPGSDGYILELIEKNSDFYIVKSLNPYTNHPGKLYKLKPSKEVIKKEY